MVPFFSSIEHYDLYALPSKNEADILKNYCILIFLPTFIPITELRNPFGQNGHKEGFKQTSKPQISYFSSSRHT